MSKKTEKTITLNGFGQADGVYNIVNAEIAPQIETGFLIVKMRLYRRDIMLREPKKKARKR